MPKMSKVSKMSKIKLFSGVGVGQRLGMSVDYDVKYRLMWKPSFLIVNEK